MKALKFAVLPGDAVEGVDAVPGGSGAGPSEADLALGAALGEIRTTSDAAVA